MLKSLHIQNIILIEEAKLPFLKGLNVLSGETGSGKSAIMDGLSLVFGEKADTGIIRKGCEKGIVEAVFEIEADSPLATILDQSGIEHDPGCDLIIRREMAAGGKSRSFVNNQIVQSTLLKKLGAGLVHIVGQHDNQRLFSLEHHRDTLDLYGDIEPVLTEFQTKYNYEASLLCELNDLIQGESQRIRDIDRLNQELEELDAADIKEGEDEALFEEYTLLAKSEEIAEKLEEALETFSSLPQLHRQKANIDTLAKIDPALFETAASFNSAILELQETAHTLTKYRNNLASNPDRARVVNERLTLINRCKRKYGQTVQEIRQYKEECQEKLKKYENADWRIEELKELIQKAKDATQNQASELTKQRQKVAKKLEKALTEQIRSLNMPSAECIITISLQKRSVQGDDKVEFFLVPNKGEHQVALREGASGGEISRFLLSLQTLLAGKEQTPILIFDEVDANIGGETAGKVGEKLKSISEKHQVLCITHFPQVASHAGHHLQISKQEKNGRTLTLVKCLDTETRAEELDRMIGKKK